MTADAETFSPLHSDVTSPNFRLFWAGQTVAVFGMRLSMIAMPVVAVNLLRASEEQVGYLGAFSSLAFLILGLPAGAWVDRWLKRPTMMAANLVRAAASSAVPLLYLSGNLQMWHLYVVAGIVGLATVFFDVAYQSFLPILVPTDQIGRANSKLESTAQIAMTAGPAIGGLALKVMSAPMLLLGTGIGYFFSFLTTLLTVDSEAAERTRATQKHLWRDIREGLSFSLRNPVVRMIIWGNAISATGATIVFTLLPVLVLRTLGLSDFTFGLIMTGGALGGLLGALLTGPLMRRFSEGFLIPAALLGTTLGTLMLPAAALAPNDFWATAILIAGEAFSQVFSLIYNILQVSLRQRLCPRELMGRMNASIRWIVWGLWPLASVAAGLMATHWGLLPTLWIGAISSMLAFLSQIHMGDAIAQCEPRELENLLEETATTTDVAHKEELPI